MPPHAGTPFQPTSQSGGFSPAPGGLLQSGRSESRPWTRELDQALIVMWTEQGLSAAEIGRRLGVSKNAVIGRSHRLRLPSRPSPIIRNGEAAKPARERLAEARTPAPAPRPAAAVSLLTPAPEPQERLRGSCHWPLGHPRSADFAFCGEPCSVGKPYCEAHCRRAYIRRPIVCAGATASV
ncbi:MAG: GcrA cell cycle regulator [Alphaproteobacteria bacterium]|nr:GcrA cell cycle regulator [Alphaproteobacteria bacterium]